MSHIWYLIQATLQVVVTRHAVYNRRRVFVTVFPEAEVSFYV